MKDLVQSIQEIKEQQFTLAHPMAINKADLEHPIFQNLMRGYKSDDDITRIVAAIINAAISQNRLFFKLCKDELRNSILKNDPQFKRFKRRKNEGLRSEKYSKVLKFLHKIGVFQIFPVTNQYDKKVQILRIVDTELAQFILARAKLVPATGAAPGFTIEDLEQLQSEEIAKFYARSKQRKQEQEESRSIVAELPSMVTV